ncbi:serine/threonine protein kinase [Nostoc sp. ATCC 43529]|nr:serine/threonine protein kinase [Nostoc sp. ATCC 43529]
MSYKVGDLVGKYTVTRDFDSANGGQCQWGFAEYGGEEFFIKKFLNPVYPGSKAPGSEKGKQKRRDQCYQFEKKQLAIIKALSACGDGGLVVRTIDCFKHGDEYGEHYFKVSQKVDTSSLSNKVHTLDEKKRLFVMLTAAGALKILHQNGIIHLDLKPDNILIQEYGSRLIAKIIDFDSSMLEGESIESEMLVGDPVYYSPEFARHIATFGETPPPTKKSDIFSLGLIFCRYWTGGLPVFPSSYNYVYEAILKGKKLSIPSKPVEETKTEAPKASRLKGTLIQTITTVTPDDTDPTSAGIRQLIEKMLLSEPEARLSISEVHQSLKHLFHHGGLPKLDTMKESEVAKTKLIFGKNLKR